jgi:4-amino-4-deoxy-L-arabinose transferase-like glycosyltransferase
MDDYAQYVLHARNLAEGRPYADTGYILNPAYQTAGPVTYPPVFPLLLAPVYKLAGTNLQAMKAVTVVCFAGFLYVLWLLFRRGLGERRALLVAALAGLSPVFWKFKDYLYAEYPFLLFSCAALCAWRLARAAEDAGGRWLPRALLAGLLAYLAYGTRSAGAVLLPAFLLSDLVEKKNISKTFLACCLPALGLAAAQWLTLHSDAVYAGQARELLSHASFLKAAAGNLLGYADRFTLLFDNGYSQIPAALLLAAAASLAAAGFVRRAAREPLFAAYALLNAALLLAFPAADGLRYAFPLVPFLFYYAAAGWQEYSPKFGRAARYIAPALLLAVALSYAGAFSKAQYGGFREGTEKAETKRLFEFVRSAVPPEAVVICRKPRTLSLLTGRRASMYHFGPDPELLAYFKEAGAGYLIAGAVFPEDRAFLFPFLERNPERFLRIYANADFSVYKIR